MQNEKDIEEKRLQKKTLRKEVLEMREKLPDHIWQEKSRQIKKHLIRLPGYQRAEHILCYVNYRKEVQTLPFLRESLELGKHVYCPAVLGEAGNSSMEFYEIFSEKELAEGFCGIYEPSERESFRLFSIQKLSEAEKQKVLMVMPGAVFDKTHHRIGYGGGYYDRYFAAYGKEYTAAALAFSFQIKDEIVWDMHDVCPDLIVTEYGILKK